MWRIGLRPAAPEDADSVDPWLSEALASVAGRAALSPGAAAGEPPKTLAELVASRRSGEDALLVLLPDGRPGGIIVLRRRGRQQIAVEALAIGASDRNLGYGAEAIYALEERYPGYRLLIGVPLPNGLAIYFWLRIGYCPIFPRPPRSGLDMDRLWMARGGPAALRRRNP